MPHSVAQPQPRSPIATEAQANAWQNVTEHLLALLRLLEAQGNRPKNLMTFAEGMSELGRAYLHAITSEGRTSMRAEAVVRALDLHTPKSALLRFLGRD